MSLRFAPPRAELLQPATISPASLQPASSASIVPSRHDVASRSSRTLALVATLGACRSFQSKLRRCAAPALKRVVKEDTKTKTAKTHLWGVVIRAPIWKGRWWQFWKPVLIRMGLRTYSVQQFAEKLEEALPELLTREKAQRAAGELVETALIGDIGKAVVLGDARDKAERCRQRLQATLPDLEVLVEPMP
ncbi:Acly [Symbiodinium natans]|uniref:Acly protein n=1 Tax=Symbiodinium natans TaxID=878477 RepID=A0A812K6R3_9DINO|nr:Acly [Symbiodinium natans]